MSLIRIFQDYKPPKKLRTLFIVHYAPLLLIIMIGPITPIYSTWKLPLNLILSIIIGIIIFITGTYLYFKWEFYWHKIYKGQLITDGIFKHIRHPHYTSLLIIGFGLAFFFYSLAALILSIIAIPIMIWSIFDEEKLLMKKYGDEYRKFMKKTPWRMVPGIF
jgi:protein-S-isoprenylcysteine O-methyltransferase Ste14